MAEFETPVGYLVTAFWNQAHLSRRLINSYLSHSDRHWRWIIIDNGSTDQTPELKEEFARKGLDFHWISNSENKGVSAAWNEGIRVALKEDASIIGIINNDLIFTAGWDTGLINFFNRSGSQVFCPYIDRQKLKGHEKRAEKFVKRNRFRTRERLHSEAMFFTREVFEKTGLFDERYFASYEDTDYFLRLREQGIHPVSTGASVVWHGEGVSSRRHLPSKVEIESREKFFNKWKAENILTETGWDLSRWQKRFIRLKDKLGFM